MTDSATTLTVNCPRCGQPMQLRVESDAEAEIAAKLARLLVCDHCMTAKRRVRQVISSSWAEKSCPKD